jgi:hypothetical protein
MSNVLSVDPGLITGYVMWRNEERDEGELDAQDFLVKASELIEKGEVDVVVCERFVISSQTGKFSQAPWSLEQIGVLRYLCNKKGIPFVLQNVSDAKRFADDKRLNHIGWKKPKGAGHARDAQRHLLLYLTKNKLIDTKMFLKKR